jgi:V8-like Glu-specific endopeptidase
MKTRNLFIALTLLPTIALGQGADSVRPEPKPDVHPFQLKGQKERGVFGEDDRKEVKDAYGYKDYARATAVMVNSSMIKGENVYGSTLREGLTNALGTSNFHEDVKFLDQPIMGNCTGFLIGPDILLTAGHCVKDMTKGKTITWIFDYTSDLYVRKSTKYKDMNYVVVPKRNQYKVKEIIAAKYNKNEPLGDDYCILRLDREADRDPYRFRITQKDVPLFTNIHMIGSPTGLPLKYTSNAFVMNIEPANYFTNNLDGFQGNSGGPVFNSLGFIEGIHVRGRINNTAAKTIGDYYVDPSCNCIKNSTFSSWNQGQHAHKVNKLPYDKLLMAIYDNISYGIRKNDTKRITKWLTYRGILRIDYTTKRGPLEILAAKNNNFEALKLLLAQSKQFNIKDKDQYDLVYYAVKNNNKPMLEYLLKNGASPNTKRYNGTALHLALSNGYTDVAKLLIEKGAKLNEKDNYGNTPLHLAARSGRRDVVELLIRKGAYAGTKNDKGWTARKTAKKNGYKSLSKYLKKAEKGKL